jgi:hypothetical protein
MENYPENIKDAIDWVTEADIESIKLQEEYDDACTQALIKFREEDDVMHKFDYRTIDARVLLECAELRNKSDAARVEVNRRIRWVNYFMCLHSGKKVITNE